MREDALARGGTPIVQVNCPHVTVSSNPLALTYGTGGTYGAFDRFGRVVDQKWEILDADFSADADNKSDWDNVVLYCGCRHDTETGLYHVRNRYYHAGMGVFIQRDPEVAVAEPPGVGVGGAGLFIGPILTTRDRYASGMNLYVYVQSKPIVSRDPRGLAPYPSWGEQPGAGGVDEPDPVYDKRMMDQTWNRAMYHYDCLYQRNGRTNCPPVDGGHQQAYEFWLKEHNRHRERYELNKAGGGGHWVSDYYRHRVTCEACKGGTKDAALEEHLCREKIRLQAGGVAAVTFAAGLPSAIPGSVLTVTGGGLMLVGGPTPVTVVGVGLFAGGAGVAASGGEDIASALAIGGAAIRAADLYCNCKRVIE